MHLTFTCIHILKTNREPIKRKISCLRAQTSNAVQGFVFGVIVGLVIDKSFVEFPKLVAS